MEESGVPRDNYRPAVSHRQTLSHNVLSSTPCLNGIQTHSLSGVFELWCFMQISPIFKLYISLRSAILLEETGNSGENHRTARSHWQIYLPRKLLNQGFPLVKLKSSLRKFYGCHHDLVDRYGIYVSQMTMDMFHLSQTLPGPFLIHDLLPGL